MIIKSDTTWASSVHCSHKKSNISFSVNNFLGCFIWDNVQARGFHVFRFHTRRQPAASSNELEKFSDLSVPLFGKFTIYNTAILIPRYFRYRYTAHHWIGSGATTTKWWRQYSRDGAASRDDETRNSWTWRQLSYEHCHLQAGTSSTSARALSLSARLPPNCHIPLL